MLKLLQLSIIALSLIISIPSYAETEPSYVGSKVCAQCHEQQYNNFKKHSKKATSWESISVMKPKLKDFELKQCYECHTTGFGKKGGFVSFESTPQLAEVGCETCHGPGSVHADSSDIAQIKRRPSIETCTACHNPQRIEDFRFKPLIFSGAH